MQWTVRIPHIRRLAWLAGLAGLASVIAPARAEEPVLIARIIAVGLPGAGAVSGVGYFHPGGPIRDKPEFAAFTQPGRILDPDRVLVTSTSNFGAPKALPNEPEGAVLSIDASGTDVIAIPAAFATQGNQASALGGRVQLFTAQSPAFLNGVNTPKAVTAELPPVSNPLGISINNGFGRLWCANTPSGPQGIGTESIIDPAGQPLAGAPSKVAGGVFAGDRTNRQPQQLIDGGLRTGAVANALLGLWPDGSKRAVFAVLTADGAIAQAHTEQTMDGLAPAGTIAPLPLPAPAEVDGALITRAGLLFNWVPERIIYVSDPVQNAVVALKLADDGKVLRVDSVRRITAPEMSAPVDLAPVVPEVGSPGFASNTALAGASDIYVLNRGNGTILRVTQAGQVVAARRVAVAGETLGARRLNGIAVSRDAQKIWLTVSGALPGHAGQPGALIEVPAFGPGRAAQAVPTTQQTQQAALVSRGAELFQTDFTPAQGLGPLYDKTSCVACHSFPTVGGTGPGGLGLVHRVGRFEAGRFDPLLGRGGPMARQHAISELGVHCPLAAGMPPGANLVSMRNAPTLFGAGLLEAIPDAAILARAAAEASEPGGVAGRPNVVRDAAGRERVGRFGWKGHGVVLAQFVAEAMRNEMGLTNPLAPKDLVDLPPECSLLAAPKDDGTVLYALTAFVASPPAPLSDSKAMDADAAKLFASTGCAACHTPAFHTDSADLPLYSDLLLHDMGAALDDNVVQSHARGRDWRTTPLWGLGGRVRFLHDGRATTLRAAITAHDGEAARSAAGFRALPEEQQERLLGFLAAL
jgi:mono/diheme cytochrome c family protein